MRGDEIMRHGDIVWNVSHWMVVNNLDGSAVRSLAGYPKIAYCITKRKKAKTK